MRVHRVEHVPTREGGSDELSSFDVTESNQYSQRENHGKLKLGSYEAYDRETKAGACRRITKHSDFEYCPTPMEHGSFTLKCLLFSLSFLSQLVQMIIIMVIDMSGESNPSSISGGVSSSPKSESKTVVVRLSLTSVNANFVCQIHEFIEKAPARG
ncbi:hypothetical protein Bca52824_052245 [Brassica carinata]|uniref:Uncharacterized protein n=1 Tax=Brassica carinata TaxID=52824 RepID=A0A8X7UIJ5_BRACI|nr:hypothetical protein Bca52824_052245 [Brassica carinata]